MYASFKAVDTIEIGMFPVELLAYQVSMVYAAN